MYLSEGKEKEEFTVEFINLGIKTKKRLQDMGITQGGRIKIMSIIGNHASIYKIRGSRVGLGKEITSKIEVTPVGYLTSDKGEES